MPVQRVVRVIATALTLAVVLGTGLAWSNVRSFEDGIFHMSAPSLGKGGDDGAIDILLVGLDSRTDAHGNPLSAEELAAHNVDVAVVHTPTLKPFDTETILREVNSDRLAVTLENHTVIGGLFETVAAAAVQRGLNCTVVPIALPDEFLDAGALPTLHDRYGLSTQKIVASVLERL